MKRHLAENIYDYLPWIFKYSTDRKIRIFASLLFNWWAELRTMLRHLYRRGSKRDHLSAFNSVQFTMYYTFFFNVDAVVCLNNGQFQVWELNIWQFIVIVEIKYVLNLNEYYLPIFILSIHVRQISFFFKSPKTFRVIITIMLCCLCYMPKYVPRLEGIMHDPKCIMPSNLGTYFGI